MQQKIASARWSVLQKSARPILASILLIAILVPAKTIAIYPSDPLPGTLFWLNRFVSGIGNVGPYNYGPVISPDGTLPQALFRPATTWSTNYFIGQLALCNQTRQCAFTGPVQCVEFTNTQAIRCSQTYDFTIPADPPTPPSTTHSSFTIDLQINPSIPCPSGFVYTGSIKLGGWPTYCNQAQPEPLACHDSKSMTKNPCDAATGNKYQPESDYNGSDGIASFTRSYNSQFPTDAGLGFGWVSSNKRLGFGATSAEVRHTSGRGEPFTCPSSGVCTGNADTQVSLTRDTNGYTLTRRDDTVEHYDNFGFLTSETDRNGRTTSYTYLDSGQLSTITGPYGHTTSFTYFGPHLASVTDPFGGSYSYAYDANDNLSAVTYPDGATKLYHYENTSFPHHLTGISYQESGGSPVRYSTYSYDANGKAITSEHAGPIEHVGLSYDSDTQTTITDAANTQSVLTFNANLGIKNLVTKLNQSDGKSIVQTFDAQNNLTCEKDDEGRVTTYTYNSTNQRLSMTEGLTGTCTSPTSTAATRTTNYQYVSSTLDLPTVITSPSVFAGQSKTVTIAYGDASHPNLPTSIVQSGFTPSGSAVSRAVTMSYTSSGQLASIDGARGDVSDVTSFTYYNCTTGGACGQLQTLTNALGQVTTFDTYDGAGRLLQMTDPNGLRTNYTYDPRGRVSTITQTPPVGSARITQYTYNAANNVTQVIQPDGITLTYTYDAAQKLRQVTDNLSNQIVYNYDLKGNRTQEIIYDAGNTLVRQVDTAYDARNHVSSINAGGSITQQLSDAIGNVTKVTDPNQVAANSGIATNNSYDALNRITQTLNTLNGSTTYGYDSNDRLTQVVAPNNATTQYQYDDLGNLLKEISPDRGTTNYTYDSAGNITSQTDARGIVTNISYDALNRVTSITYPASTSENITYTYDSSTNCHLAKGKLCVQQDESGTTEVDYDGFGNIATARNTELGTTYTTQYLYDAGNRLTRITYANGRTIDVGRDNLRRIASITSPINGNATAVAGSATYRPDGLLTSVTLGSGFTESRSYDPQGRLATQTRPTPPTNTPPTANAGPNQTVNEGATVTLSGSGSDPDGTISAYQWTQTIGPAVTLTNATTATASFTAPQVTTATVLTFKLTVTDNKGATGSATTNVTVNNVNQVPTVNAGANQSVNEGASVTLSGSATDPDGTITSYQWTQTAGPAVTLTNAATQTATFTAPQVTADTVLTFRLTATDNEGGSNSATTNVTVRNVNQLPTANAGTNQTVNEGAAVTLSGSGTDPDGTISSFAWTQTAGPVVTLTNANTATATFTAPQVNADTVLTFRLTVTDNNGGTGSATTNVTVKDVPTGKDLVMTAVSTTATQVNLGQSFTITNTVKNQGTTNITGSFSVGLFLSTDSTITTSDTALATRTVTSLNAGASNTATTTVTVPTNLAPGTYFIGAIADSATTQAESNETNNSLAGNTIQVIRAIDLTMTALSTTSTSVNRGSKITISNTVKNQGTTNTIGSFGVGLYLSTDSNITTSDTLLTTRNVSSLAAGASSAANTQVTIPTSIAPGTYFIGAIADNGNTQAETNETNNSRATTATIQVK